LEEYIGSLCGDESSHPAHDESTKWKSEGASRPLTIKARDLPVPTVWYYVHPACRNRIFAYTLGNGSRDSDHGIEPPENFPLDPFIETRHSPQLARTVERRDSPKTQSPGDVSIQHIGTVSVCMNNIRPEAAAEFANEAAFLNIRPPRQA
jgi:hypothetical protein